MNELVPRASRTLLQRRHRQLLATRLQNAVLRGCNLRSSSVNAEWVGCQNKAAVDDLLFKAASQTLLTIAADPKHLGVKIGMTSVLHTWGSAMAHHPHVHIIVPCGGLSRDGTRWTASRKGFLLSVKVLSRLFRRLFLEGLVKLHKTGKLVFFGKLSELTDPNIFAAHLAPLHKTA